MSTGQWTAFGEAAAGMAAVLTLLWGLLKAARARRSDRSLELDKYLTRSLDGFTELVENLQTEVERQRKEREEVERRAHEREKALINEVAALRKEVEPLRKEVKLLRDALQRNGIPIPTL